MTDSEMYGDRIFSLLTSSVTRLGEILPLWQNFKIICATFKSFIYYLAKLWTYFGNIIYYWANLHPYKWPNIENSLAIWSRCNDKHKENINITPFSRMARRRATRNPRPWRRQALRLGRGDGRRMGGRPCRKPEVRISPRMRQVAHADDRQPVAQG